MPIHISTDLVEHARTGDPPLARAIVVSSAAAEDVAQEACVAAYRTIASLRAAEAFGSWFYRIVVNEALKSKTSVKRTEPLRFYDAYEPDMAEYVDLWRAFDALSSLCLPRWSNHFIRT